MLGEGADVLQAAESRCVVSIMRSLAGTSAPHPRLARALDSARLMILYVI
jgi:hypothetical protein